ncbi:hypothetical protein GGR52DRAFT_194435 [Hypoxylon sp. FL1284]|nr:hypothetical protein GGR52DRAFT_194435 [Hypoxylon sp. FL1284]
MAAANMANMPQLGNGSPLRQRPPHQQLSQLIYTQLIGQPSQPNSWQEQVQANMRVSNAMNVISNSFLAMPAVDSQQLVAHGLQFEREAFINSPDKVTYEQKINSRVQDLFKRRQANEQSLKNTLSNQSSQAHAQAQAQMMMNPNMMARGPGQPPQPGFQHLQQAMQASPMPQPPHQPGMANHGGFPMNPAQQAMQMAGAHMRPQMPMQLSMNNLSQADRTRVTQMAHARLNATSEAQRNNIRTMLQQKMSPQQLAQLRNENADPVLYFFQNDILRRGHGVNNNNNNNNNQAALQAQAQAQRQMNASSQQLPGASNGDYGPFSNVESIMNQQKAGLLAQEAGQMVVPASTGPGRNTTPQPIAGMQGPNAGNHLGPNQAGIPHGLQQPFNHPQAQQLKMDQRAAQSQAQIRAQAQAKQMQGQPGVMNGTGAMSQSPGMNTLNTPVRRTPVGMAQGEGQLPMGQPNGPFGQGLDPRFNQVNPRPQMGGNQVNPQMFNQPMPNAQPMLTPQMLNHFISTMNPDQRALLMSLPPDKKNEMALKMAAANRANHMAGRGQPPQGQFGQVNPNAQFSPGNPGNSAGQQPSPGMPMNQNQAALQQRINGMRNGMHTPNRPPIPQDQHVLMDAMEVPPRIMDQIRSHQNPPPPLDVKKWSQLKQWIAQKSLPPASYQNLMAVQNAQFHTAIKQQQQQQQQQNAARGNQMPQAGMPQQGPQPPNGPMPAQPPPNLTAQLSNLVVTPQELEQARNHERFKGIPEDKLKLMLQQMKMHSALRRANTQTPGGQMPMPQTSQPNNNNMMASAQPPNTPGALQQRRQNAGSDVNASINANANANATGPAAVARNNRQPQINRPPQSVAQQRNSLKRPSTDDVVEVPNPSTTPAQRPQSQQASAPAPVPAPQGPQWNPSQPASHPPEQKSKAETPKNRHAAGPAAGPNGQQPQQPQLSEEMQRLKAIGQEEHNIAMKEPFHEIPMSDEQRQEIAQKIQGMCQEMAKLSKVLGRWYTLKRDDNRARMFFKTRLRLIKQYADGDKMTILKNRFSLQPQDLDGVRGMLEGMARDVATTYPQGLKRNPATQQAAPEPGHQQAAGENTAPPSTGQSTPLNAANLEKQTQTLNKMHQRTASKGGQTPAAPTTTQPPFQFGAQSPSGMPTYGGKPAVTQEDLHLPARKKVKTGPHSSVASRGPSANSSPQVQKASSPEMVKRSSSTDTKPAPKLPYACPDEHCEAHFIGFATETALRSHQEQCHVKPYQDPKGFVLQCTRDALGLDENGKSVGPPKIPYRLPPEASAMNRGPSGPGSKPAEGGKTNGGTSGTPKPDAAAKGGNGAARPAQAGGQETDWSQVTVDPQDLLGNILVGGGNGAISDMKVYRAISPHDTPESTGKDSSSSEPNSDVSEGVSLNLKLDMGFDTWQPFGGSLPANMDPSMSDNVIPEFSWDDIPDDFDQPWPGLDPSLYSMDIS